MIRLLIVRIVLLSAPSWAQAPPPQPTVLVRTQAARQGSVPRTLTAYGSVQPSADGGSEVLSVLRAGQVVRMSAALGQQVRQGQPLITLSADPAALSAFRQAAAALVLAQGERGRMVQMLAQHLATRDQLALTEKAVADAEATIEALNRAGGGSTEQTLAAPFDGMIASVMVAPGARVAAGGQLLTVSRSNRLVIAAGVEPRERGQLAPGQPARIEPLDGTVAVSGQVLSISGMLDPVSRMLPVFIATPAPGGLELLSGSPVRVVVQVGESKGWLVPRNAVMTDGKGEYLFQVNGTAAARVDVRVVAKAGGITVVDGPLDAARPLVVSGQTQLQDGGLVRNEKAVADGAPRP